ncbi:MAG: pyridoxal phosphate-dependent aminotransferase [Ignavibacteria bacterium]|nr:MAG: pyridoxal phosphate-dependent aminotransferase [Ignavibacteria bacterium]
MPVSSRIQKVTASQTMKISAKAIELKSEGKDVINLSVGEPDFTTPDNIKQAAIQAIERGETKYTVNAGIKELRQAISNKLKTENNLDYAFDEIIVSNGAKHSLYNAIQVIVDEGDEVIIPAPYWVSYPNMVSLAGGKAVVIETTEETGFRITPDQLEKAITGKTKALILCNPSNPTGAAYPVEELEKLLEVINKYDFYIISDEIYEKLVYDEFAFKSFPAIAPELRERIILVNGVSKAYAMTGWRIGYTAAPKEIIAGINKIQSHSTSNASSVSQYAALEALTGPQDALQEMKKSFEERRNFFYEAIGNIDGFICPKPEGAFYLFPNIKGVLGKSYGEIKINNSFDLAMYLIDEALVATVPGSAFGAEGYLRLSYALSLESLKEAAARIKEAIAKLS